MKKHTAPLPTCAAAAFCAALAATAFAEPRVPYANDFVARTSGPVPSARWMEAAYVVGPLARTQNNASITAVSPYASATACQDGWAPKRGWSSGSAAFAVADDGGDPAALANGTGSGYANSSSVVLQPFANEFASGTLTLSADIRTPPQTGSLNPAQNAFAMVAPVYRAALDVAETNFPIALRLGPASLYDGRDGVALWSLRAVARGRTAANAAGGSNFGQYDTRNDLEAGRWVRYEAVLDLDAGTYTATFADLGDDHPTTDTATAEAISFRAYEPGGGGSDAPTTLFFDEAMTPETGGVSGLALFVRGLRQADASAAPMFDNVRVWHDGELVYENDFATRRYRTLVPAGTTAGSYPLASATNAVVSAPYDHGSWENDYGVSEASAGLLVPATGTNGEDCEGWDGWRRRAGGAGFSLLDPNKNGGYGWTNETVLRVTKKNTLGVLAVPLGTTVTNGKVRLCFDLMPGRKSVLGNYTEAYAMCFLSGGGMGTAAYTGSTSRDTIWKGKAVCGAGYYINGSTGQELNPGNVAYGAGTFKANCSPNISAQMCNWHRYVVTADLDAKTYEFAVYKYGTAGQPADYDVSALAPIASKDSLAFMTDAPAAVDSLFIASQGHGDHNTGTSFGDTGLSYGKFPLFDNLRVCLVEADGSDGLELYRCDFDGGVRRSVRAAAPLAVGTGREGADRWTARGPRHGSIDVLPGGVAALDGTAAGPTFAVQPFGSSLRNAAAVELAADVRPPTHWAHAGGGAFVEVGGDAYFQGVSSPAGDWRAATPRLSFGFAENGGARLFGAFANVAAAVATTAGTAFANTPIDTSHWHRFRVKARLTGGACTVRVFDQGADKPDADDPDGALVATFPDVPSPFGAEPLTTLGLGGSGVASLFGGGSDDPTVALFANLAVDFVDSGMLFLLQ